MRELPESSEPKFCSIDGLKLYEGVAVTYRADHFDVLTGVEIPFETHAARKCPAGGHDEWRLYDHKWLKVHP